MAESVERTERGLLLCDTCGNPCDTILLDLGTRDTDYLCWPCLLSRMVEIIKTVSAQTEGEDADAAGM